MAAGIPLFVGKEIVGDLADGFQRAAGEWISVGVVAHSVTGTGVSAVFSVEWSFDNALWAAAQPGDTVGTLGGPGAVVQRFTVKAPYWRLVATITGTNPVLTCSANALI